MTDNDRFDAALRAHVFHRPFLAGEAAGSDPAGHEADEAPAAPAPDFASQLEASLVRDLNALAAGLRPTPKKLLPERVAKSAPEPPPVAAEAKPASPYAPPSRLPPAAWPITPSPPGSKASAPPQSEPHQASERRLSPYAPQPKLPLPDVAPAVAPDSPRESREASAAADPVKPVSRYAPPKRPGYPAVALPRPAQASPEPPSAPTEGKAVRLRPADGIPTKADEGAAASVLAAAAPVKAPVGRVLVEAKEAAEEPSDFASPEELAKLYAPVPPAVAAPALPPNSPGAPPAGPTSPYAPKRLRKRIAAAPGSTDLPPSDFAPRAGRTAPHSGDGGSVRPIRWQASDEAPPGAVRTSLRDGSWTSKAAVAFVLIALIGGAGAVVTLESLSAPEPSPGMVAADRTPAAAPTDNAAAVKKRTPTRSVTVAARVAANSVEVIHADDAGNGLAPADGSPLPGSAKVIPLPQPVPPANDPGLRPTRDAASGGDGGAPARTDSKVATVALPADGDAPAAAAGAGDQPTPDGGDMAADGSDNPAAPPRRMPTPRPAHDGASAEGVLAYAPAAEPIDHVATAFAKKGDGKPAANAGPGLSSGSARVTAWVNMRASADNKAATVKVLPAGSIVTVVQCKFWCEIVADGKRGFVFKSFLKASGDTASAQ